MKIQVAFILLAIASIGYAKCPAEQNSQSYCNCHAVMGKNKSVGDCHGDTKQLLRKSAHNAQKKGYKHYLCCRPDDAHATCYGIAYAVSCNWESGIAFLN
uniref:Cytochrome c n=1 Tax=Cunninghamella elegans TaxID=4853 RepID=Q52NJ8_CUNEL|nr:cytochrome c [Cunninghamella elegans]